MVDILVLAPHADDEVFGCGGMMARRAAEGDNIHVVVFAVGGLKHRHLEQEATTAARLEELKHANDILGVSDTTVLFEGMDMRLDTVPQVEIVSRLDDLMESNYDEIYFPYSSFNHDHQTVFNATYSALRMKGGNQAPIMSALYEYPEIGWNPTEVKGGKLYVDITDHLETKMRALSAYKSQIRPHPNPLSLKSVSQFAAMRGIEAGFSAAELFYVQRMLSPA
jgi:LmbE family N-acetylglucosaminyl deacetylase